MHSHLIRYAATILIVFLLHACGGGGGGGGGSAGSSAPATVTGVAAAGAAIAGTVTLKDATGATRSATISLPSGNFSLDVTGLTPPYFLKATSTDGSITLYSVATGPGTFNINPLTNMIVVAAAMSIDPLAKTPDLAFANPAGFASLTQAQIDAAAAAVMAQMSPAFKAALIANGASSVNPLTDLFQIGNGLDRTFDAFVITLNTTTGEVQQRQDNITTVVGLVDMLGTFPGAGVYTGSILSSVTSQTTPASGLILASGEMRYVTDDGVQVVATLTASGNSVSGAGKTYPPTGSNGTIATVTITGTLTDSVLAGSYSSGADSGTFSFTRNAALSNSSAALSKITGAYVSTQRSGATFIGHIEPDGDIWGSGPGAVSYSGKVEVIDADTNAYRVTMAYYDGNTNKLVSGLATFDDTSQDVALSMSTALAPAGNAGEITALTYSSSAASQGRLMMQLSSASGQLFVEAAKLSSELRTVAMNPSLNTYIIQATSGATLSATVADGSIQYSASGPSLITEVTLSANEISIIGNPISLAANGILPAGGGVVLTAGIDSSLNAVINNQFGQQAGEISILNSGAIYTDGTLTGTNSSVVFTGGTLTGTNSGAVSTGGIITTTGSGGGGGIIITAGP